jgi:hypothetical protein
VAYLRLHLLKPAVVFGNYCCQVAKASESRVGEVAHGLRGFRRAARDCVSRFAVQTDDILINASLSRLIPQIAGDLAANDPCVGILFSSGARQFVALFSGRVFAGLVARAGVNHCLRLRGSRFFEGKRIRRAH